MINTDTSIKTNLEFKDHREFFGDFMAIRKTAFILLAESMSDKSKVPELYKAVNTLIDFSSNYIHNIDECDQLINHIDKLLAKKDFTLAVKEIKKLLRLVNSSLEKTAILPQKSDNYDVNEKFWRDEESKAMQEMKKAFYDVFMKK